MNRKTIVETREVILAGDLILVEDGSAVEVATSLVPLAEKIEDYCGEKVSTILRFDKGSQSIRFQFSRNRYIEFETVGTHAYVEQFDNYYHVLQLKDISHLDRKSLVVRIMFDIFNWK